MPGQCNFELKDIFLHSITQRSALEARADSKLQSEADKCCLQIPSVELNPQARRSPPPLLDSPSRIIRLRFGAGAAGGSGNSGILDLLKLLELLER